MAERKTLARSAVSAARSVGSKHRLRAAGLDAREVEQRVDQLQQPQPVAVDELQLAASPAGRPVGAGRSAVLDRPEHQRQRGAELVADVAEEGGLGPVQLGQRLGAPALLLVGAGVGDGGGDVVRRPGSRKSRYAVVQRPAGADAGDQRPSAMRPARAATTAARTAGRVSATARPGGDRSGRAGFDAPRLPVPGRPRLRPSRRVVAGPGRSRRPRRRRRTGSPAVARGARGARSSR